MEEGENPARGRAKSSPGPPGCRGAAASQRTPPPVSHRHGRGLGGEGVPAHLAARGVRRFRTDAPLVTSGRGRGLGECRHRPAQTRTRPCGRARAGMGREGIEFAAGFGGCGGLAPVYARRADPDSCMRSRPREALVHDDWPWPVALARPGNPVPAPRRARRVRIRRWPRTPPPRSGPRPPRARSRPSARRRRRWRGGGAGRRRSRGWPPAAGASRRRRGRRRGGR